MFLNETPILKWELSQQKKIMTKEKNSENWSQLNETVLMLNVAVSRIERAMNEGEESFTTLSESFVGIANSNKNIISETQNLDNESPIKNTINENCKSISGQVDNSIIAFQFYDRLSQRMVMVSKILSSLSEVLNDPDKTNSQDEWVALQDTIRSNYTLDADQEMFDAVLTGTPIEEALKITVEKTDDGDIEFF